MEILDTFHENTENTDFRSFLYFYVNWLRSLQNDRELYNPIYRQNIYDLKEFLKDPECYFEEFLELYREYMILKYAFKWYPNWTGPYQPMSTFFEPIVSELEYIWYRTPCRCYLTMHETNRELYRELNAYILHPERLERISGEYGLECPDYLDAIAV